jgi:hypothetical protein
MSRMTRNAPFGFATATAVVALFTPAAAPAQSASAATKATGPGVRKACVLLTDAEVEKLINRGRPAYGTPEEVALAGGSACEYPAGAQVVLFSGPNSQRDLDALLRNFEKDKEPRHPVSGIGDRAWIMFPRPRDQYEDRLAYLVTTVGPHTVAVSMAAKEGQANGPMMEYCRRGQLSKKECAEIEKDQGETPESLQPAVEAVARVVVAKLR